MLIPITFVIRRPRAARLLFAGAAVAGCASRAPSTAPSPDARFTGCYALTHGPWLGRPALAGPPPRFRLLADVDSVGQAPFRRAMHRVRSNGMRGFWSVGADDSVRVTWSTGFGGFQLRAKAAGRDTLRGIVTGFSDTRGSVGAAMGAGRAEAVVARVPCLPEPR